MKRVLYFILFFLVSQNLVAQKYPISLSSKNGTKGKISSSISLNYSPGINKSGEKTIAYGAELALDYNVSEHVGVGLGVLFMQYKAGSENFSPVTFFADSKFYIIPRLYSYVQAGYAPPLFQRNRAPLNQTYTIKSTVDQGVMTGGGVGGIITKIGKRRIIGTLGYQYQRIETRFDYDQVYGGPENLKGVKFGLGLLL